MNNQFRNKNAQMRKGIRKRQLEEYFKQRRQQLTQFETNPTAELLNEQVRGNIAAQNTDQLYELLFKGPPQSTLTVLTKSLCEDLFKFLAGRLDQIKGLLILKGLILVQYRLIFLNKYLFEHNSQFVLDLYRKIESRVEQLTCTEGKTVQKQSMKYINCYLDCLTSLLQRREEEEEGHIFDAAFQLCNMEKLWSHFRYLHMNPFYLKVLCIAEIDLDFSTSAAIQNIIVSDPSAVQRLILQIKNEGPKTVIIALSSLMLANAIVKNLQENRHFIELILPTYMEMLIHAHKLESTIKKLEGEYFPEMLENVVLLIERLSMEQLPVHLGELMSSSNLWTSLLLLLRLGVRNKGRCQIYEILRLVIKNILINKAPLRSYVTETLISFIVEGAETEVHDIVLSSLQTIEYMVHDSSNLAEEIVEWFNFCEINNILENLQYSAKREISDLASHLIKKLNFIQENGCTEMSPEKQ